MTAADGRVVGTQQIVANGPASILFNLVVLGDGYTSHQLGQFAGDAQAFCETLFATAPFDGLQSAMNQ